MALQLVALTLDAQDRHLLASFWSGVLGWRSTEDPRGGVALLPSDDTGFRLRFVATDRPRTEPNQLHLDLTSSSLEDQQATVERSLSLGAQHLDVGQGPDAEHVVLADPEANEYCVIEPGNGFLADCGTIGALSGDGSQAVGYFWSRALDWPLVWDQDEETAIRSPQGGPKLTWGGPPVRQRTSPVRNRFDLAPVAGDTLEAEVERLVELGARRVDRGPLGDGSVALTDPDGNEFHVLPAGTA
jgi:hypothetical protein